MNGRLRLGLLALVTGWFAAISLPLRTASAQEPSERFRVMVPDIQGLDGADKKFGERLADELRDLIKDMITHQPIEERELKRALDEYDIDMKDLNCVMANQLAGLINAKVVFCGTYRPEGEGFRLESKFFDSSGEEFPVEPITVPEKGQREAAEHVFQALQLQSDQTRFTQFCGEYASSDQWSEAENMCTQAIELNPAAKNSRYTLAVVYQKTDRPEEALAEFKRVLELDPLHEAAMQWAGNLSATLGRNEEARSYYQEYLQLDPTNANVRMRVAYELAQAGDAFGAMELIEEGLTYEPENVELLKQHGGFAFTAGAGLSQGQEEMPQEARELFRKALASYDQAYGVEGAEMEVVFLTNMVKAYINLDELEEGLAVSERILQTHGSEAEVWSIYGDALQRSGRVDDALAALDRAMEIQPDLPNAGARQGRWLLDEGRVEDAVPVFQSAVARGEKAPDEVSELVFVNGYQNGVRPEDWSYAIPTLRTAKEFDISDEMREKIDFFLGYSILKDAIARQEARTKESAQATIPLFQEARRLLQVAAGYAQRQGNLESDRISLLDNIQTFIEIQEAIIKRGL